LELHPEHRVRQRLDDSALDLDAFFLGQPSPTRGARAAPCDSVAADRMSAPSVPTATVCSKCALSEPSFVTTVQPSSFLTTSGPPTSPIGSIASTWPAISLGPRSGGP